MQRQISLGLVEFRDDQTQMRDRFRRFYRKFEGKVYLPKFAVKEKSYSFPPQNHSIDRAREVHDPQTGRGASTGESSFRAGHRPEINPVRRDSHRAIHCNLT
jgi:hypothetical protein